MEGEVMSMGKWDPFQDLIHLRNRFMELVDRSFMDEVLGEGVGREAWHPPVDFFQGEHQLVLNVEIAGVDEKAIEIELNGSQIVIRGDRPTAFNNGEAVVHRLERQHGPFRRVLELPVPVDPDGIEALYDAGVLTVTLPIRSGMVEKKIRITPR